VILTPLILIKNPPLCKIYDFVALKFYHNFKIVDRKLQILVNNPISTQNISKFGKFM